MGSAFHQLCPRYSGTDTLTPTAPTAIRLWDTFTFYKTYCLLPEITLLSNMESTLKGKNMLPMLLHCLLFHELLSC